MSDRIDRQVNQLLDSIAWLHASCSGVETDFVKGKREAYCQCMREINRIFGDRLSALRSLPEAAEGRWEKLRKWVGQVASDWGAAGHYSKRDAADYILAEIDRLSSPPAERSDEERPMCKFPVGTSVSKVGGDYRFDGVVVAAFAKLSGMERYVVEDDRGVLHIYGPTNLVER